ncbi:hypothetical protein FH115_07255 [Staphylococcus hominis]|uniref:hypothetical protein n=1 Tax=Staphylococcus hominis TaxID=1290 RepID=UPI001F59B54E|nr:hypothetical protein [Staphylococcus hominis]MCI2869482.1 hypothetical protein [Staphylococcus hominis]MDS3893829.1 hypothetical protein [Staphylococcus hominis]
MLKIKRKVEMTLPELIEWAWKNDIKEKVFYSNLDGGSVYFDMVQTVSVENSIDKDETFTVEVEKEITEETKLPKFLVIFLDMSISNYIETSAIGENESIKEILQGNEKRSLTIKAIHLVNDDETHTLIWKDGELVGDE